MSPPDSAELLSQARTFAASPPDLTSHPKLCSLEPRNVGEITPMGGKKVTFGTILATEGPSKESSLGFPT